MTMVAIRTHPTGRRRPLREVRESGAESAEGPDRGVTGTDPAPGRGPESASVAGDPVLGSGPEGAPARESGPVPEVLA
jgi:hypothetical protein